MSDKEKGRESVPGGRAREIFAPLQNARVLAGTGMLSAAAIVLGFFKIPVTELIEIRFMSLPLAVAGFMFGPAAAGLAGMISDIGAYLVKPTGPFFPGFTITSILSGVIFGCVLYGKKPSLQRILLAEVLYTLICGVLLNSLCLSILYGWAFPVALSARFLKELVMIPVNTFMLAAVLKPVQRIKLTNRLKF